MSFVDSSSESHNSSADGPVFLSDLLQSERYGTDDSQFGFCKDQKLEFSVSADSWSFGKEKRLFGVDFLLFISPVVSFSSPSNTQEVYLRLDSSEPHGIVFLCTEVTLQRQNLKLADVATFKLDFTFVGDTEIPLGYRFQCGDHEKSSDIRFSASVSVRWMNHFHHFSQLCWYSSRLFGLVPQMALLFSGKLADLLSKIDAQSEPIIQVNLSDHEEHTVIPRSLFLLLGTTAENYMDRWSSLQESSECQFSLPDFSLTQFNKYCLLVVSGSEFSVDSSMGPLLSLVEFFDFKGSFPLHRRLLKDRILQGIVKTKDIDLTEKLGIFFRHSDDSADISAHSLASESFIHTYGERDDILKLFESSHRQWIDLVFDKGGVFKQFVWKLLESFDFLSSGRYSHL